MPQACDPDRLPFLQEIARTPLGSPLNIRNRGATKVARVQRPFEGCFSATSTPRYFATVGSVFAYLDMRTWTRTWMRSCTRTWMRPYSLGCDPGVLGWVPNSNWLFAKRCRRKQRNEARPQCVPGCIRGLWDACEGTCSQGRVRGGLRDARPGIPIRDIDPAAPDAIRHRRRQKAGITQFF